MSSPVLRFSLFPASGTRGATRRGSTHGMRPSQAHPGMSLTKGKRGKAGPALQRLIPGSELVMIPECGHLPHVEQLNATLDALYSFWAE